MDTGFLEMMSNFDTGNDQDEVEVDIGTSSPCRLVTHTPHTVHRAQYFEALTML